MRNEKIFENKDSSNKVAIVTSFSGILLGLLGSIISTVDFNKFNENQFTAKGLMFLLLLSVLFLTMSTTTGITATFLLDNNQAEKYLKWSIFFLSFGLTSIPVAIAVIITQSLSFAVIYLILLVIITLTVRKYSINSLLSFFK
jgi:hypothetical protein